MKTIINTHLIGCKQSKFVITKDMVCRNPSFGLATKAKGLQGKPGSHIRDSWECRKVWGSEPSHSQGNSHFGRWSPKTSETDLRGQISMACGALYINGKLLKRRCLKWARIAHLNVWNTSYNQKKVRESNSREFASFDSRPLKSGIDPEYLAADNVRHTVGRLSTRATTLLQIALRSKVCSQSYAASKSWESRRAGFRDSRAGVPGVPGEKSHLDVGPVESHRVYYKGEGGGFPQVRAVVSLVCPCCPWLVLAPKVLQLCTNHFVWVVCRPVWVNKLVNSS
jgi:hypothetical protein